MIEKIEKSKKSKINRNINILFFEQQTRSKQIDLGTDVRKKPFSYRVVTACLVLDVNPFIRHKNEEKVYLFNYRLGSLNKKNILILIPPLK